MKKEEIILGISNLPALKELMYAEKGKGAFLNGSRIRTSPVKKIQDAYLSAGGLSTFTNKQHSLQLLKLAEQVQHNRAFGDAWNYSLLAQGKLDIVLDGRTRIWDIAPHKIIVEEAGGKLTALAGTALKKQEPYDYLTVLGTNGFLHDKVIKLMDI